MKAISVYALTREQNIHHLQKLERQLSERDYFLKIKEWELNSMKGLVKQLEGHMKEVYALRFFYSFQIPKLGKEFDLLQIKEDQILNLELKSGIVSDEAIRKQLIQNRYYLSVLGRTIRSYTYISSQNRLVRLTNHDHIVEADWEQLCQDLQQESADYKGDVEDLFQAELYLISPITEAGRFLRKEYFLTSQQRDIERQILKGIRQKHTGYYWFIGLPGTGKTLLLYDLAMKLSGRQKVCLIHCGRTGKGRITRTRTRYRDISKTIGNATIFLIIGTEFQSFIDYSMPVRVMDYDTLEYKDQIQAIHTTRKNEAIASGRAPDVDLSPLKKEDRLVPVITLVLYMGEDPWNAAKRLHDLLDFSEIPHELRNYVSDYPIHVLDICHTADERLLPFTP